MGKIPTAASISKKEYSFPEDIRYKTVRAYGENGYKFTLGASIIKFNGVFIVAYLESLAKENDGASRLVCKYSFDNCKSFSEASVIAEANAEFAYSHSVFYDDGKSLWIFAPKAAFGRATPEDLHPNLVMEAYLFNENERSWTYQGTVLDTGFWPLCEPITLSNGRLIIGGCCPPYRKGRGCRGGVAISDGNPLSWKMVTLPNPDGIPMWGETAVADYGDELVAFVRINPKDGVAAISKSRDGGESWTPLVRSNIQANDTKMYAGRLQDGRHYLISNIDLTEGAPDRGYRSTISVRVSESEATHFGEPYIIRNGFDYPARHFKSQWAYPYAVEENGFLYVVYTKHKEENELAVIPIASLK